MALYMSIGYKNPDGSVDSISMRADGGENHNMLFYKYYRTPGRVRALIENGSNLSANGIYISEEELDRNSKLYNDEVTMLPLYIGRVQEKEKLEGHEYDLASRVDFSEESFYRIQNPYKRTGKIFHSESVDSYYDDLKKDDFSDDYVYLYDPETLQWTRGFSGESLKEAIIYDYDREFENSPFYTESLIKKYRQKLIDSIDEIDLFINTRGSLKPTFVDKSTNNLTTVNDPKLIQMCHQLSLYARTKGINIDGYVISMAMGQQLESFESEQAHK